MLVEGSSYHITLIIECIWCSGTRMYPLWNATHIWPIWPSWRVEPDTGREVSRAPASCDLSSMLGLSTQLLEERCSLGCWETKTLTFTNNPWFSPTNLLITGHTSSLFPLCCCATSDDADRFVRNNLVEYAPTWAIGRTKLARFCFWLQRPSHVCHFSGHFWWVESPYICISASGVHSSSILVAPDVSIVYQDKAWKLGDLKMRFPMFCLIRSHSFRSLNFDALQDPILMISRGSSAPPTICQNLLHVLMVGQWGLQVDCENLPCLSVLQLQSTKHHLSKSIPMFNG